MIVKTLRTLAAVRQIAEQSDGRAFVRWSRGPALDRKQGKSRDYANGGAHAGLSASQIDCSDWSDAKLARRVKEYRFLRLKDERINAYLYIGEIVGEDSDGYESINITGEAYRIAESVIAECEALDNQ